MQTKEHIEAKDKVPPSTADVEPDMPEKAEGPAKVTVQRAMQQPQPTMPPARAAEMLSTPQPMTGAAGQAQMMKSMQQSVGNARVARLAHNAPGNTPLVQRQPQPAQTPTPLEEVQSVHSLHIEENLEGAVTGAETCSNGGSSSAKQRLKEN